MEGLDCHHSSKSEAELECHRLNLLYLNLVDVLKYTGSRTFLSQGLHSELSME